VCLKAVGDGVEVVDSGFERGNYYVRLQKK
jgi:hypothetical protein